jgi:DNA-binding SARP family transcriptional activator
VLPSPISSPKPPSTMIPIRAQPDVAASGVSVVSVPSVDPPKIQVRLLGPVDLRIDGLIRPVPGLRRKALLATLALHASEVVSTDDLIEAVWGESAPPTAINTLQRHVSYLRRLFGQKGVIRARAPGYVLILDGEATDVTTARRLIRLGTTSSDPDQRVRYLQAAVALWRGRPLMDITGLARLDAQAENLKQLLLTAKLALVPARLDVGQHIQVLGELEALTRECPLNEEVYSHLMLALYRAGRQSEALAVYRRLRSLLHEDLGIEPSQPLRDLEAAILRQDTALYLTQVRE